MLMRYSIKIIMKDKFKIKQDRYEITSVLCFEIKASIYKRMEDYGIDGIIEKAASGRGSLRARYISSPTLRRSGYDSVHCTLYNTQVTPYYKCYLHTLLSVFDIFLYEGLCDNFATFHFQCIFVLKKWDTF